MAKISAKDKAALLYDCLVMEIALHNAVRAYVMDETGIDIEDVDFEESLDLEQAKKDAEEIYGIQ